MSAPGLMVRCLASTRVAEVRQETESSGQHHATNQNEDTAEAKEDRENLRESQEDGDSIVLDDHLKHEHTATPILSSSSDSSDYDDSESDSSGICSTTSQCANPGKSMSCIQEAQLSPDGTCIFTSDYDRAFSVYPIGTDILGSTTTQPLKVYSQFKSADPIWAFATNPFFNLQDSSSTLVLISRRDRYVTLHNALWDMNNPTNTTSATDSPIDIHTPLASYKLINHLTEAITAPLSLAYSNTGTHFFAGTQNSISIFDLSHTSDPISSIPTIPSARSKLKGGGRGFKGHIPALAVSPPTAASAEGLLAAGSRTRYVGIYDAVSGAEVTHFSLPGTLEGKKLRSETLAPMMGDGVSSLKWSPCGRYLYIAERDSDALLLYDVRSFSMALGYCAGRRARTKQKLGFDVWNAGASPYDVEGIAHEVWAGGTDGKIRVWKDPYLKEGAVEADEVVDVGGEEMPVVTTLVHASGSLAVAARGTMRVDVGTMEGGTRRGGGTRPRFSERGCLDILGLSSY
ncbi:hypothetical protein E8E12_000521 [Didymella heteroderae]|uniref:WD40 repeat-like protein n=1 Tax=Didymella heteroderae TaxID=1769908 RepID=A0A9P4WVM5_9PLEO|nr:hypothetical protein E8E12_000521 [Didymella heteroderae]